jgi:hypothetical protein
MRFSVEDVLAELKSATNTRHSLPLFNRVTYILNHDRDYTKEERARVAAGAKACLGFTNKQKKLNLPEMRDEDESSCTYDKYEGSGWSDDQGSYD